MHTNKTIFVDVDGTLFINGKVNTKLIEWCRQAKDDGYSLILWSARGKEYAEKAADQSMTTGIFESIISKPGYIVDDKGWSWIKYTKAISRLERMK